MERLLKNFLLKPGDQVAWYSRRKNKWREGILVKIEIKNRSFWNGVDWSTKLVIKSTVSPEPYENNVGNINYSSLISNKE